MQLKVILLLVALAVMPRLTLGLQVAADTNRPTSQKTCDLVVKLHSGSMKEVSQAAYGLHALGEKAIPDLIESISNDRQVANLLRNPASSYIMDNTLSHYSGIRSAFMIELILARESLPRTKTKGTPFLFGPDRESYIYDQAVIVKDNKQPIDREDLIKIKGYYQKWWEDNKGGRIEALRKQWLLGDKPLKSSGFYWV